MTNCLPKELKKWNWGAFFLTWIWGIGTESWQALWAVIPVFGFFWAFVCGAKGNEWAWKAQDYQNIWHFNHIQRKWAFWSVIITLLVSTYYIVIFSVGFVCAAKPDKCPLPKSYIESHQHRY